ncbi:hypothetical protein N9500_00330 [Candidatus Pelagibacter sp.]|jgi:hypothetical protein|nr:hypothetical protein [Candidatus Pelagibacter sp.]
MKFNTFYKIFYEHRVKKANILLKAYLIIILPFKYLTNLPFVPKKINLDQLGKNNLILQKKSLNDLFNFFNSDKGDLYEYQYDQPLKNKKKKVKAHGYAKFYEEYFKKIKNDKLRILEIGSFYGNASASLFFYFRNSFLYAGDIFPDLFRYKSKRVKNFFVNSSEESSIKNDIIAKNIQFNIIIEDASHSFKDQIISLFLLFKSLEPKGLFIIEELDFPDTRKDMNLKNEHPTLREILNKVIKRLDFHSEYISPEDKKYFMENFDSIEVFKGNFNEIAIIKKR